MWSNALSFSDDLRHLGQLVQRFSPQQGLARISHFTRPIPNEYDTHNTIQAL